MRIVTQTELAQTLDRLPQAVKTREGRGWVWTIGPRRMAQIKIMPNGARQCRVDDGIDKAKGAA